MSNSSERLKGKNVILGAGPAGLGCALGFDQAKSPFLVLEKESLPGGLCRTLYYQGFLFDLGGHRFLSKSPEVLSLWNEILDDDLIQVKRLSRIYYNKKLFHYPLTFLNTFSNLGFFESTHCLASYLQARLIAVGNQDTFEGWISHKFGRRLYRHFFKTYTEKVWALDCREISADWARQRIRGLSFRSAVLNIFLKNFSKKLKTLSDEFLYPRQGPGQFYSRLCQKIDPKNIRVQFNAEVNRIFHKRGRVLEVEYHSGQGQNVKNFDVEQLFSSIPITKFLNMLSPRPPADVMLACSNLRFRSFIVVNVILDKKDLFPDQWIYVHSPDVRMGRIQNYKNWSPSMTEDAGKTSLGLEYFCNEGDDLWNMADNDLIELAVQELEQIGFRSKQYLQDGFVTRCADVYPIYSLNFQSNLRIIRDYLDSFDNFHPIGRAGLFRYDNSDHAILTGIYAARNHLYQEKTDIWQVDIDENYWES